MTQRKLISLACVLRYRHPGVVRRYAHEHQTSMAEAQDVFRATLKWLYLCYRSSTEAPGGFNISMTPELEKIDWMWHTFILFTLDYATFCERYFGVFLHHLPESDGAGKELTAPEIRAHLETQLGLVHDILGPATLRSWYDQCRYGLVR